ncbi:AraC-like DNA-binding protein [Pseudoduganella flava]|uniref:AraC-like DNA-binding protein n=1 Tax=Pseudoduganella flava TaxID=871742 RepID=A0A562Q5C0_9BURK|nr:AraC family transcriptional regulator [Pseudoduganella flava]QGZ41417.1 helix-turn-helix domain-containing protein [Pseudoduganella flava]TWI51370.1 AraC-like DNA-binding protein [Pseudoduganella flava]
MKQPVKAAADWLRCAEPVDGLERIEARLSGNAYALHRHDTYAIGRTISGVQSFNYRRDRRDSLPGSTMVLHPDEPHDGQAGTDEAFHYRMMYVSPTLIQAVLGGHALPFVEGGLSNDPRLAVATTALLRTLDHALEPLEQSDALAELAHALALAAGAPARRAKGDFRAARRAQEYLHAHHTHAVTLADVEAVTGRDRWSLSNDFRRFYGTSPYRYVTMRRLDTVRRMLLAGLPLADAALAAGFADQSHMTRHFQKTFGQTPARWLGCVRRARRG